MKTDKVISETPVPPEIFLAQKELFSAQLHPDVLLFGDLVLALMPLFQGHESVKQFHDWQKKAAKSIFRQIVPTIKSDEIDLLFMGEISPALVGKLFGHVTAALLAICDGTATLPFLPAGEREQFKAAMQAFWTNSWSIFGDQIKTANILKYKLADAIEFSNGFQKALSCTVDITGNIFSGQGDYGGRIQTNLTRRHRSLQTAEKAFR